MGKIKPTLSIVSNAASATTDAGPLSFALNLTAKPHAAASYALDVTKVESKIIDVDASEGASNLFIDASSYGDTMTEGIDGGFVYLKNLLASTGADPDVLHDIMIGATSSNLDADVDASTGAVLNRIMTLKPGEFAFFPWDFAQDLYFDAKETNTNALECWVFVRTGTA